MQGTWRLANRDQWNGIPACRKTSQMVSEGETSKPLCQIDPMMPRQLFVDYHFHPNFNFSSRRSAARRAAKIWRAFYAHRLDVVVVSEHSWKRPVESFQLLQFYRPPGARLVLLPGVEVLTREGLDVVVFGNCRSWYEDPELHSLLRPYRLRFNEVVDIVGAERSRLAGFLPHPYTRGTTGSVEFFGRDGAMALAERLGGVEASNNCYGNALSLSRRLGARILPATYQRMHLTACLDEGFLDSAAGAFLAHGSDAHFPEDIGYGCLVESVADPDCAKTAFSVLCTNGNRQAVRIRKKPRVKRLWHTARSAGITLREAMQKRALRRVLLEQVSEMEQEAPREGVARNLSAA
jgi:hypothetical protein